MKTLAIIGANYLQLPLVRKDKEMGVRTVCFAWESGSICKDVSDVFYPISVFDKDSILEKCLEEHMDGITSIAPDIVVPTMAHVAMEMFKAGITLMGHAPTERKYRLHLLVGHLKFGEDVQNYDCLSEAELSFAIKYIDARHQMENAAAHWSRNWGAVCHQGDDGDCVIKVLQ